MRGEASLNVNLGHLCAWLRWQSSEAHLKYGDHHDDSDS